MSMRIATEIDFFFKPLRVTECVGAGGDDSGCER